MKELEESKQQRRKEELEKTRNELKRATDKAKKEYLESICDKIMEFQRTGHLMHMKTRLERKPCDSKHGHRRLSGEYNNRSETSTENF
jgi:hypothetical protein